MSFKTAMMNKYFVGAALTVPLVFGTIQPAYSATRVFGDRNAGGPGANFPALTLSGPNRIIAACVDGWVDSVRCSPAAQRNIADEFCEHKGYREATSWFQRRNARRRHDAYVFSMSLNVFTGRVATGHPMFFTEITCEA